MNRREIKYRIAFKIWTAVPRGEKYKIGAAVPIWDYISFILFRNDSFKKGQSNMRRFIYERSANNIHDWSLAYILLFALIWCSYFPLMLPTLQFPSVDP